MSRHSSKYAGAALACLLAAGTLSGSVAEEVPADARVGVEATLNKVNDLFAKGGSAQQVADVLYEDDLTVTGEGEKGLYPNLESFMKPLAGYLTNPTCRLTLADKIRHSGNLAVAWVQEHCDHHGAEKAEDYRIMYVFRKSSKGWRTTMELFVSGTF